MKSRLTSPRTLVRTSLLPKVLGTAALLAASTPMTAHAEADSFGMGTGADGAITVATSNVVVNSYAAMTSPAAPGDTSVTVTSNAGFSSNALVLVWQATGLVPAPASGTAGPLDVSADPVGRWEFARIKSMTATTMTFTKPLTNSYAAQVSQIVRIPEYTSVTLNVGGSIVARAWDGKTGGIAAFLVTGNVTNNGAIRADAAGFRAGAGSTDTMSLGCSGLNEASPTGAGKGEGIVPSAYLLAGRGNVANGAGGGVCLGSGGGGGGGRGSGGQGGRSADMDGSRSVGGLAGGQVTYSPATRLLLGGGGGGGAALNDTAVSGGAGGGIVFFRAAGVGGSGSITARGATVGATSNGGGGGGGAGGTIYVRVSGAVNCTQTTLAATGGVGGRVDADLVGPGGGGGGGAVLLQSGSGTCIPGVSGGAAGIQPLPSAPDGLAYGSLPGSMGVVQTLSGAFTIPASPVVATPANGSTVSNKRPTITGSAPAGASVIVSIDDVEIATMTADAAGNFSYTAPADLAEGQHRVAAQAEIQYVRGALSNSTTFTVDVTAPNTSLVAMPPALTNATSSSFTFSSDETNTTFECSLDSGAFTNCTSPTTYDALSEASHTFQVRARDAGGNVDPTPASYNWVVDRSAPETTIGQHPDTLTNKTNATFAFSSEAGATFQCKLDAGVFAPCTSPVDYTGLIEGSHTFAVRAIDSAGNVPATPGSYSWEIDTTSPVTLIGDKPEATTLETSATFSFTSEANATFACRLDTAATFTPCTSPMTIDALAVGNHTFEVRATDTAGNVETTPANYTWTVEKAPVVDAGTDASTSSDAGSDAGTDSGVVAPPGETGEDTSPTAPATDGGASGPDAANEGESGCNVSAPGNAPSGSVALFGLAVAAVLRRRRAR